MLDVQVNGHRFCLYYGQVCPLGMDVINIASSVVVQATEDELMWILEKFQNIPKHISNRVQTWSGRDAKFILMNLW